MRKVIVEAEISLNGIMNGQEFWGEVFKYHSDDVKDYLLDLLMTPEALVMGRMTYEFFAEVWPSREGNDADHINTMPKYVASRTLDEPLAWNATLIKGDIVQEISKLKQQPGGDLLQYGVGELTETMLQHGLVDELRLVVFPFTIGEGQRSFDNMGINNLKLVDTRTFSSGAIALHYQPDRNA